jgi:hypothetical protein
MRTLTRRRTQMHVTEGSSSSTAPSLHLHAFAACILHASEHRCSIHTSALVVVARN